MTKADLQSLHLGFVLTPTADGRLAAYADGAMAIQVDGRLGFVGSRADLDPGIDKGVVYDHGGDVLFPGFVDLHVHLPQLHARARVRPDLLEWLHKEIYPAEVAFSDPDFAQSCSEAFVNECIRNGITTTVSFLTVHEEAANRAFRVVAESGLRAIMGTVQMDRNAPEALVVDSLEALSTAEALAGRWHGHDAHRIQYALTPRFAISCSDELLHELGQLKSQNPSLFVHTHLSEQPGECAEVARLFPEAMDYLHVYEDAGLVGPRSIFAHCIHVSDRELSALVSLGAGVAHCPSSNLFLKSGRFPWQRAENAGLRFGVGSDIGAGPEMSPFRVLRDAFNIQTDHTLTPDTLLWRATLGAAQALGMEDTIGSLETGKDADFVVLDPRAKPELAGQDLSSPEALCSSLVFLGDERIVKETWVRGRRL
jgi:guanine deaminase